MLELSLSFLSKLPTYLFKNICERISFVVKKVSCFESFWTNRVVKVSHAFSVRISAEIKKTNHFN